MSFIITSYDPPPVRSHSYDWSARRADYDGAPDSGISGCLGFGATPEEAIEALLELEELHCNG